jgi:hypothetical protein
MFTLCPHVSMSLCLHVSMSHVSIFMFPCEVKTNYKKADFRRIPEIHFCRHTTANGKCNKWKIATCVSLRQRENGNGKLPFVGWQTETENARLLFQQTRLSMGLDNITKTQQIWRTGACKRMLRPWVEKARALS